MPKQTFFNLPPEKRAAIEQAALDEFARHGYDNSNMNRIVEQSRIAKGSFYQYFEDKKDLYFHLIDSMVEKKMRALEPALSGYTGHSFSHNLEEAFRLGLAFADSDPKLYRMGEDFTSRRGFMREYLQKYQPLAVDIYGKFLEHARETGELRDGLDVPLTSSFIHSLINQTSEGLIAQGASVERRDKIIAELIRFIERAVLKTTDQ